MENMVHIFQLAGLGIAPFSVDSVVFGDWTNCEFCFTPIKERCHILSSDGKIFIVGNECVNKTGDTGLIDVVKREVNRLRKEARHKKEAKIIAEGQILIKFCDRVEEALEQKPHPYQNGKSYLDFLTNKYNYSGNKGRMEVTKEVKEIAQTVLTPEEIKHFTDNHDLYVAKMDAERVAKVEAEEANRQKDREAFEAKKLQIEQDNKEILDVLYNMEYRSDFIWSMIGNLKSTEFKNLSTRQKQVLTEIYGKSFGRMNSKEYKEAVAKFEERMK